MPVAKDIAAKSTLSHAAGGLDERQCALSEQELLVPDLRVHVWTVGKHFGQDGIELYGFHYF